MPDFKKKIFLSLDEEIQKNDNLMKILKSKFFSNFIIIGILRFLANLAMFTGPLFLDLLTNNLKDIGNDDENNESLKFWNLGFSLGLAGFFFLTSN